jgi:hypothetical protein
LFEKSLPILEEIVYLHTAHAVEKSGFVNPKPYLKDGILKENNLETGWS